MNTNPTTVQPCFRCGAPAEKPAIAEGQIAGQQEDQVPLCLDCLELLLNDHGEFWRVLRERHREAD